MTQSTERLDEETERRLADFRYCALSDTSSDDLSPFTEAARDALRSRIRELIAEARKPLATLEEIDTLRIKAPYMSMEFRDLLNSLADRLEKTHPLAKVIPQ